MPAMDAGLVFLPRFTTLIGETEFTTAPLDVSGQAGTQFQVWRGPLRSTGGSPAVTLYLEESLDTETWALGPSTPQGFTILENATHFFAYSFRLRWFRLRVVVGGTNPMVSCWAEGILRAGDGGMWGMPGNNPLGVGAGYPDIAGGLPGPLGPLPGRVPADAAKVIVQQARGGGIPLEAYLDYLRQMQPGYRFPTPPQLPNSGPAWMNNPVIPVTPPQLVLPQGP